MTSLPDSSLEAGLTALKQGDYNDAIAHLESVCEIELDSATIVRAQMGLVVAYASSANVPKAQALCQHLTTSVNPQVKQWADTKLLELAQRYPSAAPTQDPTGFVPLDQTPGQKGVNSSPTEVSGFVPLESIPPPENRQVIPPPSRGKAPGNNVGAGNTSKRATPDDNLTKGAPVGDGATNVRAGKTSNLTNPDDNLTKDAPTENVPAKARPARAASAWSRSTSYTGQPHTWRQANRAQRWQPLPVNVGFKPDLTQLWGVQVITALALFWMLRLILSFGASITNDLFLRLPYLEPIQAFYSFYYNPTVPLLIGLAILLLFCPWLLDGLLKLCYGKKPLSVETLTTHSQEAARVLQRLTRERKLPLPKLGILPTNAPIALTYGNLPNTARIVVSKGLLEQLADDEIAAIYASQIGHIIRWDFVLMSIGVLVVQIPYTVYWSVAQWGEQWEGFILRGTTAAIASTAYGIYWLLRWPLVWLSRIRIYFSDRYASDATGNPNGLSRAILKIAIGIAKDIEQQGKTSWLLEGFDLLMPLGYRQAITLGSLYPYTAFEQVLAWDYINPYRRFLAFNNSHPLTGDRLQLLARYAQYWKLETELNLIAPNSLLNTQNSKLFLQGAPYFGMLIGLILGAMLWLLGAIGSLARIRLLSWLLDDYWWFLQGFVLAGFSIGTVLRINPFFPDITSSTRTDETTLPELLAAADALPTDSQPVRFQGKLLGRPGIAGWLGQDLILQSNAGLVKLHHYSWLGPIGNLLSGANRHNNLANRAVTVSGWFRRGATPWIDLEAISTQTGITTTSAHPLWSTILATLAAVLSAYIVLKGGL